MDGLDMDLQFDMKESQNQAGRGVGKEWMSDANPQSFETETCQRRCSESSLKPVAQHDMSSSSHGVGGLAQMSFETCFDGEDDLEQPADDAGAAQEQGVEESEPDATGVEL